ncbi:putative LPS assembly protein LptD [Ferruginibacter sp. SUN106]|uniref:putative LPS assembly protein LptD n=1 Tax=Ferruginibacter sp. SUN106 TaxID=2978348 RepID=UPI003D3700A9
MNHLYKGKAKYILTWASALLLAGITLYAGTNSFNAPYFHSYLTSNAVLNNAGTQIIVDTPPVKKPDSNLIKKQLPDTIVTVIDTINFKTSKDSLDAPVSYHADDSMVLDVPTNKIILYGKETRVKYIDNELVAPHIEFDQKTNKMRAYLTKDSNGNVISWPTFTQADFKSVSDTIVVDMKTGKGLTKSTYTKQDEMFVHADKIKKISPDVFYAYRGRFTTCNLDTPHFSFVSNRIKFINKKMAFTGPVHPEIEGIPIPVSLPFGIFPLSKGRHSGILQPSFTANEQLGLALEGLGYYKILSDHWDAVVRGTIYSYGGWTASLSPRYYKRYHYQGNFNINIQHFRDIDKAGGRNFNVTWSHQADTKSRPGVTFSASVNAGSSKFNASIPNNPQRNFQNQMNSSITYAKVWKDKPFNLTISANHNQNTEQKLINLNLPDIAFNVNTLYPFRSKETVGNYKWFENLGIALNSNAKSLTYFYDTASNIGKQLIDKLQWGASHNVPISLSLPPLGPLQIGPSVSYQEYWYQNKFVRKWNAADKKVDTTITKGFYAAREMSFGVSGSTRIFGMIGFGKNSKVQAIRHEIRPSFGFSYHPDMNAKDHYLLQTDTTGKNFIRPSIYDGNIFSAFGEGKSGAITFGIDNNIQMKVKNKKDTGEAAIKKVTLIDGFSINSSYNLLADSFKLAPFSIQARTNLFEKISITASGTTMPYVTNSRGDFVDKLVWTKRPFSLGTLTSGNIALQTSFKGGDKKEKLPNTTDQNMQNANNAGMPLDEYQQEASYISKNPGEFANFNIPWSISFSYALTYFRSLNADYSGYKGNIAQNISFTGTLNLSPKWQLGGSGYYNITTGEINGVSMYITREMHCWQMAINLSPVGKYRFFNITISPKSSILRDLKINRTRYFYDL